MVASGVNIEDSILLNEVRVFESDRESSNESHRTPGNIDSVIANHNTVSMRDIAPHTNIVSKTDEDELVFIKEDKPKSV